MRSATLALAAALLYGMSVALPCAAETLRVCADDDYLPFSNRAQQGFENAAAKAVAGYLGYALEYTWDSYRADGGYERFLARTLDAGRCDLVMDLPYGSQSAYTTEPYYVSSYVFVFPTARGYTLTSMDSPVLRKLKIGFERDTPIEDGLKMRGLVLSAMPFDIADNASESPRRLLDAVENGTVDVLITWEPAVGGFLRDYPDLEMARVANVRTHGVPEMYSFPMSMAVRENDQALAGKIDAVIKAHGDEIKALLKEHGVELVKPRTPAAAERAR